jgi:hypothetical protein
MSKLTVENSEIRPEATIEISGYEYTLMKEALNDAFRALRVTSLPEVYKVVDSEGEPLEKYTEEDFATGKARKVLDVYNSFNPANAVASYSGDISYAMLEARRTMFDIQDRELQKGNAVSIEDLMAEFNAPKLEKVE